MDSAEILELITKVVQLGNKLQPLPIMLREESHLVQCIFNL